MAVIAYKASEQQHGHGHTPAAWVAVVTVFVGFLVGGIGIAVVSLPVALIGAALIVAAGIVGKAMQVMGFGQQPPKSVAVASPELVADPVRQTA